MTGHTRHRAGTDDQRAYLLAALEHGVSYLVPPWGDPGTPPPPPEPAPPPAWVDVPLPIDL